MIQIRIVDLIKKFGASLALDHINITIEPGELFFILGPSGCGKTTLLRSIAGFYIPDGGHIYFGEEDVTKLKPYKRNTGMVFQSYALWPHLTVAENVGFGLDQLKISTKANRKQLVKEALESVHMGAYASRKPNELSGGQQQRVALARALVIRPRCLLLDEPLSNLDAQLRNEMRLEIRRICKEYKLTTVYVTHDQKEALSIADKMVILDGGKVRQVGGPLEIYKRPRSRFIANFIGETNFIPGKVIRMGPGEAYVETGIGEFRGALAHDEMHLKEGDGVYLSIRPECLKLDSHAPDENFIEGVITSASYFGEVAHYHFFSKNTDLKISELNPRHMGGVRQGKLYAWADPEDVVILQK